MGVYTQTGALKVAVNDTTGKGRYTADSSVRITVVPGTSYTGLYAADGSMNVVNEDGSLYHPCGAIRGRAALATYTGLSSPRGALYMDGLTIPIPFSPSTLFAANEVGGWYDPSDFTTMFQDAAGTTPVTAVNQFVGCILDKSKGLVLGTELITNGDFSGGTTTGWTANGSTLSVVSGQLRVTNVGPSFGAAEQSITTVIGKAYKLTFTVGAQTGTSSAWIGTSSGGVQYQDFDSIPSGTYSLIFTATTTSAFFRFLNRQNVSGNTSDFDNISVKELPGNHLTQTGSLSRPTLRQDGSGKYYLLFDGTDDCLFSPANIDFTGTDKLTVFAGIRKLNDGSQQTMLELSTSSTTNNGTFRMMPPGIVSTGNYYWISKGTVASNVSITGYTAPITNVLTGIGDIANDIARLRVNGTQIGESLTDQGTGNFGSYALYLGARSNSLQRFNGHVYGLIIVGRALTASEITNTETWVNGKTGAY